MASRNHWYLFILSSSFSSSCAEDRTQGLKYIFFTTMPFPLTFTCHTLTRFSYRFTHFYPQSYIMIIHWSSTLLSEHFIFFFMRSHLLHGFNVMTSKYLLLAHLLTSMSTWPLDMSVGLYISNITHLNSLSPTCKIHSLGFFLSVIITKLPT